MHALESGVVLSVILSAMLLLILRANAEIMLNDYPPDIKAASGPMTERTKRHRVVAAAILVIAVLAVVAWSLHTLPAFVARDMTFTSLLAYFTIMFGTFGVFDCFVLDSALVYWQPRFFVLPGTEGMAGYADYWFHVRGFLIGIPLVVAASAVVAAIVSFFL
jgi:hypothetical protein